MADRALITSRRTPQPAAPLTGRRRFGAVLLAIGAGSTLTSGIAAGAAASVTDLGLVDPDSDLIAICAAAKSADDRSMAVWETAAHLPHRDPRAAAAFDESARIYDRCRDGIKHVTALPALTPAGLRAKASLALREFCGEDEDSYPLVRSVLMQLAAGA